MQKTDAIGTATMSDDGTLTLRLRAETNGMHGEGVLVYPPGSKDYDAILKHVGPMKPGEERAVLPWPD